jgi:predicted DNA-binding ribbon-helix-helix protein
VKSPVVKRSIVIAGHKTSISLEDAFWRSLKDIAAERRTTLSDLVASIDSGRRQGNLSSALRLFVLDHFQAQIDDRNKGGHRNGGGKAAGTTVPAPAAMPSAARPD